MDEVGELSPAPQPVADSRDMPASPDMISAPGPAPAKEQPAEDAGKSAGDSLKERMENAEAQFIVEGLRAAGWNQTAAARLLNLPIRTLQHKLKLFGITKLGYKIGDPKLSEPK